MADNKRTNKDLFERLTSDIQDASTEETKEILKMIENMTEDDLSIIATERINIRA